MQGRYVTLSAGRLHYLDEGHWPHEEEPELVAGSIADFLVSGAT